VLSKRIRRGFTLIELLVGLAIATLLVTLSLPMFSAWIADNQIQSGAESVASGLRYAAATAVAKNENVEFVLDPTTGTGGWSVWLVSDRAKTLQAGTFAEGAPRETFTVTPAAATTVTFNGLGQVLPLNDDGSAAVTRVRVTAPGAASSRPLEVYITPGGQRVKMCDPAFVAPDPKGC
jgi:type IV fimbrial biogenesis protein FimT